jgi:hypothetical protein
VRRVVSPPTRAACSFRLPRVEPTCFGTPLGTLARLKAPIRASAVLMDEQHAIHAPREVSALVNWLLGSQIEDVVRAFSLRSYAPGLAFRLLFRLTPRGIPR